MTIDPSAPVSVLVSLDQHPRHFVKLVGTYGTNWAEQIENAKRTLQGMVEHVPDPSEAPPPDALDH